MNSPPTGRSLELFFIDGKPDGMQTAEVFNWTGHVLMTPRTRLPAALQRREAQHSGVYILLGEDEKSGDTTVYVGESENIAQRIRNHDTNKDWWTQAVLVSTAGDVLHKAHIKYLEARLIGLARRVGKALLDNGTAPEAGGLTEAAQVNMEVFLDTLLMVLPALRIDAFLEQTRSTRVVTPPVVSANADTTHVQADPAGGAQVPQTSTVADEPVVTNEENAQEEIPEFEISVRSTGVAGRAMVLNGELVVLAGSKAPPEWIGTGASKTISSAKLYRQLTRSGVLELRDGMKVFTRNYAFKSPSAAASVVCGRSTNGAGEWKHVKTRKTYKQWEQEALAAGGGA